jgi:hypothetical protein
MTPPQIIQQCITRCAKAKDGRGTWQAERAAATALAKTGDARIAAECTRRVSSDGACHRA